MQRLARVALTAALLVLAGGAGLTRPAAASITTPPGCATSTPTFGNPAKCSFAPNGVSGTITLQPPASGPASASIFCDGVWTGYSLISQNGVPASRTYPESPSWKACELHLASPGTSSASAN
jgi:hypothetical protein